MGCIIGDLLTHASERDNDDERGRLPGDLTLKWAQWASSALHAQAGIKLKTPIKRVEDDDDLELDAGELGRFDCELDDDELDCVDEVGDTWWFERAG